MSALNETALQRDDSFYVEKKVGRGLVKLNKQDLKRLVYELERFNIEKSSDVKKVLKWPVEVWISTGENFIAPELVCLIK